MEVSFGMKISRLVKVVSMLILKNITHPLQFVVMIIDFKQNTKRAHRRGVREFEKKICYQDGHFFTSHFTE